MPSYVFPGYPIFLELAAAELGHPESAASAGRIASLTALANLCAQASQSNPEHVEGILAKAAEFRDQLATGLRAAELMLEDVEAGHHRSLPPETDLEREPATSLHSPSIPRTGRKGPRTEREHS